MKPTKIFPRTLALYVTRRGVAFACFVHPRMLLDWGTKEVPGSERKHARALLAARQLIEKFQPHVLVIENTTDRHSKRPARIGALNRAIAKYGEKQGIDVSAYSRQDIKDVFAEADASTKHEINGIISQVLPVLATRQPRKRRAYDQEPWGQGIFDAASLGVTFFAATKRLDLAQAVREQRIDVKS